MTERDRERLAGVHPRLITIVERVLAIMELAGHPMRVISGVRTEKQQQALYAQGRTAPGAIVTYLDGVTKRSNHQTQPTTGFGHAVDCAFVDNPDTPFNEMWDERQPWQLYGQAGEVLGCTWGGRWKMRDFPHLELPEAPS